MPPIRGHFLNSKAGQQEYFCEETAGATVLSSNGIRLPALPAEDLLSLFDRLSTAVWIFDFDCKRILWANKAGLVAWDALSNEELRSRDMTRDMSDAVKIRLDQYRSDFIRKDVTFTETWTLYPNGVPQTMKLEMRGFVLPNGRMAMICEGLVDHELHPETLRSAEALLHTPVHITLINTCGMPLYRNPASRGSCLQLEDNFFDRFVSEEDQIAFRKLLEENDAAQCVARVITLNGIRWHEITAKSCLDAATGSPAYLVSEIDVTELHETKERAQHLASHDPLTSLPNRAFVNARFPQLMERAQAEDGTLHLFLIDLDDFKLVNDTRGHAAGDALLQVFADEVRSHIAQEGGSQDFAARLGGDEFLICLEDPTHALDPLDFGQKFLDRFEQAKTVDGKAEIIRLSLGHVEVPTDAGTPDEAMRHADLALYRAKASRTRKCVSFRSLHHDTLRQRKPV